MSRNIARGERRKPHDMWVCEVCSERRIRLPFHSAPPRLSEIPRSFEICPPAFTYYDNSAAFKSLPLLLWILVSSSLCSKFQIHRVVVTLGLALKWQCGVYGGGVCMCEKLGKCLQTGLRFQHGVDPAKPLRPTRQRPAVHCNPILTHNHHFCSNDN